MPSPFGTIVADPPWPEERGRMHLPSKILGSESVWEYPLMSYEEIDALSVESLAAEKSHLYLWATQRSLEHAFTTARAWGFDYKMTLVWRKTMGLGFHYYRHSVEFCLFATRGNLATTSRNVKCDFDFKKTGHSKKPDEFFAMVERESPGPYLEMFARRPRAGWDLWGNEVESSVQIG